MYKSVCYGGKCNPFHMSLAMDLNLVFFSNAIFKMTLYNTNLRYVHTYLVLQKMPKLENN